MRCWIRLLEGSSGKKVLTPAPKREAVAHLQVCHGMSEQRACRVIDADPMPGSRSLPWVEDYNLERPHLSLGYATPAAFAAELNKQWPASLRPAGSATLPVASTALIRKQLPGSILIWGKAGGSRQSRHLALRRVGRRAILALPNVSSMTNVRSLGSPPCRACALPFALIPPC